MWFTLSVNNSSEQLAVFWQQSECQNIIKHTHTSDCAICQYPKVYCLRCLGTCASVFNQTATDVEKRSNLLILGEQ